MAIFSEVMLWYGTDRVPVQERLARRFGYCACQVSSRFRQRHLFSTCPQEVDRLHKYSEGNNQYSMLFVKLLAGKRHLAPVNTFDLRRPAQSDKSRSTLR